MYDSGANAGLVDAEKELADLQEVQRLGHLRTRHHSATITIVFANIREHSRISSSCHPCECAIVTHVAPVLGGRLEHQIDVSALRDGRM